MTKRTRVIKKDVPVEKEVVQLKPVEKIVPKGVTVVDPDGLIFRKIGGGSLRLFNRIIKPNERVLIKESNIPIAFRDLMVPLENLPEPVTIKSTKVAKSHVYSLKQKGNGLYDVVNENGKKINQEPFSKVEAEGLILSIT